MQSLPTASLACSEGGSDRIYLITVQPDGVGYAVTYRNGPRGGTLRSGSKTTAPVSRDAAQKLFDSVVQAKIRGGYKPFGDADSTDSQVQILSDASSARDTGIRPMLSNEVSSEEALALIDAGWAVQQKFDGERRLLWLTPDGHVCGINRSGRAVPLIQSIVSAVLDLRLPLDTVLDGEQVGDVVHVFDLQRLGGRSVCQQPFIERFDLLVAALGIGTPVDQPIIRLAETYFHSPDHGRALLDRVIAESGEGIVLRRRDAPYREGRPSSGGDSIKYKLVATLSAVVVGWNEGKRSVATAVYAADGSEVALGNCTVPANQEMPAVGSVAEIRYLYAKRASNKLFQPVLLATRSDVGAMECVVAQLKYQAASA